MRSVKCILILLISLTIFAGCHKSNVTPVKKTTVDTDLLIHTVKLDTTPQYSAVSVSGTKLTVIWYEDITLLIPTEGYNLSYSVRLEQDFSKTGLANFDFTTFDAYGNITYDWVDDNLNNVIAKTVTDTTIAGAKITKVTVQRPFIFAKTYATNQAAVMGEDSILSRKTDKISFSSYVIFLKTYPATAGSAQMYYIQKD